MGYGWSEDEHATELEGRREIIDAVESWLVDPRPRARTHHQSSRTVVPTEIHLDGDLSLRRTLPA
jgi:hypothetical protein